MTRCVEAISTTGSFTEEEKALVTEQALGQNCFPSGRAFWVAGTDWAESGSNFSGWYNCTSTRVEDFESFQLIMELAMMGSGTGAMLEPKFVDKLPGIKNKVNIISFSELGTVPAKARKGTTEVIDSEDGSGTTVVVGDSRLGWVEAYRAILEMSALGEDVNVVIDLSNVRPAGEPLKGFGGTSNPIKLKEMFEKVAALVNGAVGRKLTPLECCLLIDEASACVVAGNIRRSAGMRQFAFDDEESVNSKSGLYTQDENGNWKVDSKKEALRMANHTSCYHHKPTQEEIKDSITKQFYSGEGAIQYVPQSLLRANCDILDTKTKKKKFLKEYEKGPDFGEAYLVQIHYATTGEVMSKRESTHRINRYGLNPCGEIIGTDFHCNLAEIHLNTIDPQDYEAQDKAFKAGALQVSALLHHVFKDERYQYSRSIDPIVGVSFTGFFDFLVHAFGQAWLEWMMAGRPETQAGRKFLRAEKAYLSRWSKVVRETISEYCERHGLRAPNRMTTVQPAGTKSLLTGASSGWHPPKAQRFIRRITFGKGDPLVSALRDWGYSVIPAQSAKDEEGNLLNDVTDERVQEVLVEIPVEVSWANLPGCDKFDLSKLPAKAQWGLYMQVQQHYTDHNTSATIEFREDEIDFLSEAIYESITEDTGYISAALLARFDANATFPRLPFEPIDKATFDRWNNLGVSYRSALPVIFEKPEVSFLEVLGKYDTPDYELKGAAGCDSDKCLSEASKDSDQAGQKI
jgi:ribonucleotide reductase, class II